MPDFTTLFTTTLNATIAKMVADAVAAQTEEINILKEQVKSLESQVTKLEEVDLSESELDTAIESGIDNYDFSDIVKSEIESIIENYDFTEIVKEAIDTDGLFEGREFDDAVKDVIASALQR